MKETRRVNLNDSAQKRSTEEIEIEVELLRVGDLIRVYPGGSIPIDGIVVQGAGLVNESMLTGEATQIKKKVDSKVFGGTILNQGNLKVKVTKLSEESSINQIIKLVEDSQNSKAPI